MMASNMRILFTSGLCLLVATIVGAQTASNCLNTLGKYNFNQRSMCFNATYFIVPIDKTLVETAVKPYDLLPLPTNDKSLFPNGFPAGKFPVVVTAGLGSDIRMNVLELVDNLYQGSIVVPYVDRLKDGKTPFRFSVKNFIGGVNNNDVSALVPTLVGSAGGTTILIGNFIPNNELAYQFTSPSMTEYFAQVKQVVAPNPVSGPGVYPPVFDTDFFFAKKPQYPLKLYKQGINQPLILTNTFCQRNPIYFNETFSDPEFRNGSVTLYEPGGAFKGFYTNVAGLSASGPMLGYADTLETCKQAAANNDPNAF